MTIDLYTRGVLTVIALCLIWLCVKTTEPIAQAQGDQLLRSGFINGTAVTFVPVGIVGTARMQGGSWVVSPQ